MVIKEMDIIQRICSMDCSAKLKDGAVCPCQQMKDIAKDITAFFKVKVLERAEDAPEFMQYDDCKEWMAGMFTEVAVKPQANCTKPDGHEPCIVPYEKVAEEQNGRIMLGATEIGTVAGGKVLQSSNRNVITICHKGFYYHVNITDIVSAILGKEGINA